MSDKLAYKPHPDPKIAHEQFLVELYVREVKASASVKQVADPKDSYRRCPLARDPKGYYRPYLGVREDGQRQRFNLGADLREATKRLSRLYTLWEENVRRNRGYVVWADLALEFAMQVATGKQRICLPPSCVRPDSDDPIREYAQLLTIMRDQFPSLGLLPHDEEAYREGRRRNDQFLASAVRKLEQEVRTLGALPNKDEMPQLASGRLYEAFELYGKRDVRTRNVQAGSGTLTPYGRKRLERIKTFTERHEDIPLSGLGLTRCEELLRYWCNRPPSKVRKTGKINGPPIAYRSAINYRKELDAFFDWLDGCEAFSWTKPRRFDKIDRKVVKHDSDRAKKLRVVTKDTYSVEQLAELNRHATPMDRLALYLGLNCGMGAAELGRLAVEDFLMDRSHDHAERIEFDSTPQCFLRYLRPKTEVFGEFLLWPETVVMAKWGLKRSRRLGSNLLFVSEHREPWYDEDSTNPQARFANVWQRLFARVEKSLPEFPYLPFGSLRDTLPTVIRTRYSDDLASLCLTHGVRIKAEDSLLDCYSNRPFGRFHVAVQSLRELFGPVFDAAPKDPTAQPKKQYVSLAQERRIMEMLSNKQSVHEVAKACKVSRSKVYRVSKEITDRPTDG